MDHFTGLHFNKAYTHSGTSFPQVMHTIINFCYNDLPLSEETTQPTVYHHLSQVSVDMHLSGLINCREDSGVSSSFSQMFV